MKEIWKDIDGFEERYEVSNLGRIRNIRTDGRGWKLRYKKIRKTDKCISPKGYIYLRLGNPFEGNDRTVKMHRTVAIAFIPNPKNLPEVNHKNGNKLDNRVENLEWISSVGNFNHAVLNGYRKREGGLTKSREVHQYSIDGEYIASFPSTIIAVKNIKKGIAVSMVAAGRCKTAGGFRWSYKKYKKLPKLL